jgi:hypothetical protein
MMAMKCIQKLVLVMMELILAIIIEVNGIESTPFSLGPTSLPISLHVFQLDQSYNHICLEKTIEKCEILVEVTDLEQCIIRNIFQCLFKNPIHLEFPKHKYPIIMRHCIHYCFGELSHKGISSASCLLDCFEEQITKH